MAKNEEQSIFSKDIILVMVATSLYFAHLLGLPNKELD